MVKRLPAIQKTWIQFLGQETWVGETVPWTTRRSTHSILKETNPEYSLEGLMLKLMLQYFGHLIRRADSLEKTLMLGKIEARRRRGQQRMRWLNGWHHWINRHEFGQTLGHGERQGSLACCSPWGCKFRSVAQLCPTLCDPSIRAISNNLVLHIRWPKYWSFSFNISPSSEYSGLVSFRIDWFDLAVQGILKSLLQYYSSKVSILWCSSFFMIQLSHPYMTTGKNIALTRQTFVGK